MDLDINVHKIFMCCADHLVNKSKKVVMTLRLVNQSCNAALLFIGNKKY